MHASKERTCLGENVSTSLIRVNLDGVFTAIAKQESDREGLPRGIRWPTNLRVLGGIFHPHPLQIACDGQLCPSNTRQCGDSDQIHPYRCVHVQGPSSTAGWGVWSALWTGCIRKVMHDLGPKRFHGNKSGQRQRSPMGQGVRATNTLGEGRGTKPTGGLLEK